MTILNLLARRDRVLGAGTKLFYEQPLTIVRGSGVYLYDVDGRQYIDMYNNVPCAGHSHPHVVQAITQQLSTVNVNSRYLHTGIVDYAERLTALHAAPIDSVVFTCTGTEANDVAISIARLVTGGRGLICTDSAYHGNSSEVRKLTRTRDGVFDREIRGIPFPQTYRPIEENLPEDKLTKRYLAELQSAIDGFRADGIPFAGMMVCPILANEGLPNVPKGYMALAADMVREGGGLFIADEVQAGFCRIGKWWGYQEMEFIPDIVTMGKPMGNGLPLAGVAASSSLIDRFRESTRNGYFNSVASSPLQAAAGMAVLDVIKQEELRDNVIQVGAYLRKELRKVDRDCIGDIRGYGLFIGIEWVNNQKEKIPDQEGVIAVVNRLKDKGFLTYNSGVFGNILKIRPPLVFERKHAEAFLIAFNAVLTEIYG
jgi:4-aminobutyrate aminotransferase-like enzyme